MKNLELFNSWKVGDINIDLRKVTGPPLFRALDRGSSYFSWGNILFLVEAVATLRVSHLPIPLFKVFFFNFSLKSLTSFILKIMARFNLKWIPI